MDWIAVLVLWVLLIIITLASLPKLEDKEKNFILMKAQSYVFTVVIGVLLLKIVKPRLFTPKYKIPQESRDNGFPVGFSFSLKR